MNDLIINWEFDKFIPTKESMKWHNEHMLFINTTETDYGGFFIGFLAGIKFIKETEFKLNEHQEFYLITVQEHAEAARKAFQIYI